MLINMLQLVNDGRNSGVLQPFNLLFAVSSRCVSQALWRNRLGPAGKGVSKNGGRADKLFHLQPWLSLLDVQILNIPLRSRPQITHLTAL